MRKPIIWITSIAGAAVLIARRNRHRLRDRLDLECPFAVRDPVR